MGLRRLSCILLLALGISSAQSVTPNAARRFLEQASWGPTADSVAHVQQVGFDQWLEEQFAELPSAAPDVQPGTSTNLRPLQEAFFINALGGADQLRQRVAFALSEVWVVSGVKVGRPEAFAPYLRILANGAFGNYYDLMRDITLNPAMGHYLDMVNNDKPDPKRGRSANENYARELMQLFTVGEALLNQDGTLQRDAAGLTIPVYTQDTVTALARALTGWTYPPQPGQPSHTHNPAYWQGPMVAMPSNHDTQPKTLLGLTLAADRSPEEDLDFALWDIFSHPNVGPFVGRQLIQHLVMSNPSPGYVGRVSAAFHDNGSGVRGDLKAVIKAILLDPEARAEDDSGTPNAAGGHLREPALFITSLLRGLHASVTTGNNLAGFASQMGQNLYYAPSVFNYFPPAYAVAGTELNGPEFQIYSTSTAMVRANFVNTLAFGSLGAGVAVDLSPLVALARTAPDLVDLLGAAFLHGALPGPMRDSILAAMQKATSDKLRAQTALYLVGSSTLYQVQR